MKFELPLWAISMGASKWVMDVEPYESCRVAGHVTRLLVDPVNGRLEVTVTDGTGELIARWPIGPTTPQLALGPGRHVLLQGFCTLDEAGIPFLDQPRFDVVLPTDSAG